MNYKDFERKLQATAPGSETEQKVYDELLADLKRKENGEWLRGWLKFIARLKNTEYVGNSSY